MSSELRNLPPFAEGLPLAYHAVFSSEQVALLKTDLIPRDMDDKWVVHYQEPYLFVHRAGTWQPWYRVALRSTPDNGAEVTEVMFSKELVGVNLEHLKIIKIVFKLLLSPSTRLPIDNRAKLDVKTPWLSNVGSSFRWLRNLPFVRLFRG